MLRNIDEKTFAEAILRSYKHQTIASSRAYAKEFCRDIDEMFEPLVQAWISGEKLPTIKIGKYSVGIIMQIGESRDFLRALKLLNLYKNDPGAGEEAIWKPDRVLHKSARRSETARP